MSPDAGQRYNSISIQSDSSRWQLRQRLFVWDGDNMTEIKRCDNKSCGNHTDDDKCRCAGVYLIGGMCSGYRRVIVEAVVRAEPVPVLVHDKIVGRCRRTGGKWRQPRGRVWR